MIYEKKYEVKLNNIDSNYNITNRSILEYLENISSDYSYEINSGIEDLNIKKLTWFIIEWNLQILNRPKYKDILNIKVFTKNIESKYLYNDYEIYVNDILYIKASAKFVLFDTLNNCVIPMNKEFLKEFKAIDKEVISIDNSKIEVPINYDLSKEIYIRKSDIDMNNHVNNLVYTDYINELIDNEEFNNIRIIYTKEILYNDKVTIYRKNNLNDVVFVIKDDNIHMIASYSK